LCSNRGGALVLVVLNVFLPSSVSRIRLL
jgi:hypothetical protein